MILRPSLVHSLLQLSLAGLVTALCCYSKISKHSLPTMDMDGANAMMKYLLDVLHIPHSISALFPSHERWRASLLHPQTLWLCYLPFYPPAWVAVLKLTSVWLLDSFLSLFQLILLWTHQLASPFGQAISAALRLTKYQHPWSCGKTASQHLVPLTFCSDLGCPLHAKYKGGNYYM